MSSSLQASMSLDIADMQVQLARAQGEAAKFREKLEAQGRKGASAIDTITAAHKKLEMAGQRTQALFAPKAINPWAANAQAAAQYAQVVESKVVTAMQHAAAAQEAAANKALRGQFLGSSMGGGFDTNSMLAMQAQRSRAAAAAASGRGGSRGGGGNWALGGMAMQFQDIAVQAQMGTRASTILAQQGSQLLSVFGPAGMIAGGAVAIGGAFYTMGEKAKAAFDEAKADAKAFDEAMQQAANGSTHDLIGALGKATERTRDLKKEAQDLAAASFMPGLTEMVGGPKVTDRVQENADQQAKALEYRRQLGQLLAETSAMETQVAELRQSGHDKEADALEREIKLKRELAAISRIDADGWVKEQLSQNARVQSAAEANPRNTKKDREDVAALEKKAHEERLKTLDPAERYLALSKDQQAVFARMATEGGLFFEQSTAGLEAWAEAKKKMGDTTGLVKVLKMLEQANDLEQQMADANKEAKDNTTKSDEKRDKDKKDAAGIAEAKQVLDLEMKTAREKQASGKDDTAKINAFKDQLNVLQLTSQIEDRLHLQHSQAVKMAKEKVSAERAATDAVQAQVKAEEAKKTLRSRQELAAEMRVEKMRAEGDDKGADAQERRIKLVREAQRIEDETHLGEARSMALARERIANREKDEKRAASERRLSGDGEDSRPRINAHISGSQDEIRARNNARSLEGWTHPGARDRDAWTPSRMSEQSWGNTGSSLKTPEPMAGMAEANAAKDAAVPKTVTFGSREFETLTAIKAGIEKLLE